MSVRLEDAMLYRSIDLSGFLSTCLPIIVAGLSLEKTCLR